MNEEGRFVPFDIEFCDLSEEIKRYLKDNDDEYKLLLEKRKNILNNYLNLEKILDEDSLENGLSKEECNMLSKLIILEFDIQKIIDKEIYFKGGMDAYYYFKKLGILR